MAYTLPALPYAYDALEPHIDERTMTIHHTKHHQTYVTNLNAALDKHPELYNLSLEDLLRKIDDVPSDIRQAVINNGGGHSNHSLFWTSLAPANTTTLSGELKEDIEKTFGSVEQFISDLENAAKGRFGSGWAWLVSDKNKKLSIISTPNQDSPYMQGLTPLLGVDVWEHAYYLKYQNKRPEYLENWVKVINWDEVAKRYAAR